MTLKYVQKKTEEISKLAIQQSGMALKYIENKTKEIYL
jgi:hypothetical protein